MAKITAFPKGRTIRDSIVVKLFARGEHVPQRQFRLAVNEGVDDALRPLTYTWGTAEPPAVEQSIGAKELVSRLRSWTPADDTDVEAFVRSFRVELHSNTTLDMQARIHGEIAAMLKAADEGGLIDDDLHRVFRILFWLVFDAASATDSTAASIDIASFREAAVVEARRSRVLTTEAAADVSGTLEAFLIAAGWASAAVEEARALRREHVRAWRQSLGTPRGRLLDEWQNALRAVIDEELSARGRSPFDLISAVEARLPEISSNDDDRPALRGLLFNSISRGSMA